MRKILNAIIVSLLIMSPAAADSYRLPGKWVNPATNSIIFFNGSKFVTLGSTTPLQQLRVNSGGTAVEWFSPSVGGSGGDSMSISSFSGAGTANPGMNFANASGGAFSLALPTAVGAAGTIIEVKKIDSSSNHVTLTAAGSETIDGSPTYSLQVQYTSISLVSNGANWFIF